MEETKQKLCEACEGTGENEGGGPFNDFKCGVCRGTGSARPRADYAFQVLQQAREALAPYLSNPLLRDGALNRQDDLDLALRCLEEYLGYTPELDE